MPPTATTPGYVDNARLREAFLASPLSPGKLAEAVGAMRTHHTTRYLANGEKRRWGAYRVGDGTAARRDLGLTPNTGSSRAFRKVISEAKALRYATALGLDPAEIGL